MEKKILDSGARQVFNTGANRDIREGKGRCDLMPIDIVSVLYEHSNTAGLRNYGYVLSNIGRFMETGVDLYLIHAIHNFIDILISEQKTGDESEFMLEIAKHYEAGCLKYGDRNWQKGIPTHCYLDSGLRHFFKYEAGMEDEYHDRAFVWNLMCLLWTKKHLPALDDIPYKLIRGDI